MECDEVRMRTELETGKNLNLIVIILFSFLLPVCVFVKAKSFLFQCKEKSFQHAKKVDSKQSGTISCTIECFGKKEFKLYLLSI